VRETASNNDCHSLVLYQVFLRSVCCMHNGLLQNTVSVSLNHRRRLLGLLHFLLITIIWLFVLRFFFSSSFFFFFMIIFIFNLSISLLLLHLILIHCFHRHYRRIILLLPVHHNLYSIIKEHKIGATRNTHERDEKLYILWTKRPLRIPERGWEDNIKPLKAQ
jgi:hypothetical protein